MAKDKALSPEQAERVVGIIRALRDSETSQKRVAEMLRCKQQSIGKFLSGEIQPGLKTILALADLRGTSVEEVIDGKGPAQQRSDRLRDHASFAAAKAEAARRAPHTKEHLEIVGEIRTPFTPVDFDWRWLADLAHVMSMVERKKE
jgi:transcriptional regulator with XRE-family HTH domain